MTFQCKRCGQCCGVVPFNRAEMKAARHQARKLGVYFIKEKIGESTVYYAGRIGFNPYKNPGDFFTCPFLIKDFKGLCSCAIYDIRPQICRDFGKGGHPLLQCPNDPRTDTRAIDKKINEVLTKIKGEI